MSPTVSLFFIVLSLLLLGSFFVMIIVSTIRRKGKWGINLRSVRCPSCGERISSVRAPSTFQEAMWGGATCMNCNCKMDKWGNRIDPPGNN
ncbi:hypothetical protein QLX67_04560 [Balneolaceae bacterium ANBcel3]|nr:hypothetical protein [Balneolaceae bacterium ANBcel3]